MGARLVVGELVERSSLDKRGALRDKQRVGLCINSTNELVPHLTTGTPWGSWNTLTDKTSWGGGGGGL